MLEVTLYDETGKVTGRFDEATDTDVDYVSLVSPETYGPPALIAPNRQGQGPRAQINERVLFINTRLVPVFQIERISD